MWETCYLHCCLFGHWIFFSFQKKKNAWILNFLFKLEHKVFVCRSQNGISENLKTDWIDFYFVFHIIQNKSGIEKTPDNHLT